MIVAESVALSYLINAPAITRSIAPDITPAIAPAVTPLLSFGLFRVVDSRGRIWVTVFIGDFGRVCPSPQSGVRLLRKTVKVEAYRPSILALSYCS